jgi:hypothetical protein
MEAVCVILLVPPTKIQDPANPKSWIYSYWESSRKLLTDRNLINNLMNYDINILTD